MTKRQILTNTSNELVHATPLFVHFVPSFTVHFFRSTNNPVAPTLSEFTGISWISTITAHSSERQRGRHKINFQWYHSGKFRLQAQREGMCDWNAWIARNARPTLGSISFIFMHFSAIILPNNLVFIRVWLPPPPPLDLKGFLNCWKSHRYQDFIGNINNHGSLF